MASENKEEMAMPSIGSHYRITVKNPENHGSKTLSGYVSRVTPTGNGRYRIVMQDATTDGGSTIQRAEIDSDEIAAITRFSRPGAPETFAVEDRFYFGKGRKER